MSLKWCQKYYYAIAKTFKNYKEKRAQEYFHLLSFLSEGYFEMVNYINNGDGTE